MSDKTGIQWTDATLNLHGGCSIRSPGCINCYAQKLAGGPRLRNHPLYAGTTDDVKGKSVFNGHITELPPEHKNWRWPIGWRGAREPVMGTGEPSLIFVDDMSDLFHEKRTNASIDRAIASIAYSKHIGQILTKRELHMADYFTGLLADGRWLGFPHPVFGKPNFDPMFASFRECIVPRFWLGFSAERQQEFDERWPAMRTLAAMGFIVFVSYEPALGPLVLPADFLTLGNRAWVIVGGESGPQARNFDLAWARAIIAQCDAAEVACFVKQLGSKPITDHRTRPPGENSFVLLGDRKGGDWSKWPADLRVREFPVAA